MCRPTAHDRDLITKFFIKPNKKCKIVCFDTVYTSSVTRSKSSCHCVFKNRYLRDDDRLHVEEWKEKKAWPVLITRLARMFRQKNGTEWDRFCLDATLLRESSFSKTLISGPQISCQSSALDRHRIGEKAVPNKSTTCQSHTRTRACSHRHKKVRAHAHTKGPVDVSYTIAFPLLLGPNSVFSVNSRWLLQCIRDKIWSWGLSSALLINIHLQFILPHWIAA